MSKKTIFIFFFVITQVLPIGFHSPSAVAKTSTVVSSIITPLLLSSKIKGKVLVSCYLQNATVCLDNSEDFSCADEPSYLRTITASDGSFSLNLTSAHLESKNFIVETNADSSDSCNNAVIPSGRKIVAPGVAAIDTKDFIISPMLTLVALGDPTISNSYYYDTEAVFALFYREDNLFDLSRLNYVSSSDVVISEGLKFINNAIFNSSDVQILLQPVVQKTGGSSSNNRANAKALPDDFGDNIIAAAQAVGISIEDVLVDAMLYLVDISFDFPESLIPAGIAISTNEEINEILRRAEESHAFDPNNLGKTIAGLIGDIAGSSPDPVSQVVGGAISVVSAIWPETPRDYSELSKALYRDAQNMITQQIIAAKYDVFVTDFLLLKGKLDHYAKAPSDIQRRQRYTDAMSAMQTLLAQVVGAPGQYDKLDAEFFIPMGKILFVGYSLMQREYYQFPETLVERWDELDETQQEQTKEEALENWVNTYKAYRDLFFGSNASGGETAIYNRFLQRRMSDLFLKMRFDTVYEFVSSHNYLVLNDAFTDTGIEYRYYMPYGETTMSFFESSAVAIKQRLESTSKLDVAKQLTLLSYLPRIFPSDEVYVQNNIPEAQGAFSTIFPDELKLIKVGPIARTCSVSTSINSNHTRDQNFCVHPENTSDVLPTNMDDDSIKSIDFILSNSVRKPMAGMNIEYKSGETKEFFFSQYLKEVLSEKRSFSVNEGSYLTGMPIYCSPRKNNAFISMSLSTVDSSDEGYAYSSHFVDFGDLMERRFQSVIGGPNGATYGTEKTNASADFQLIGFGMYAADVVNYPNNDLVRGEMMLYPYFRYTPDAW